MSALTIDQNELDELILDTGLADQFGNKDVARVDCPKGDCGQEGAARLNRKTGKITCTSCGLVASLAAYLRGLDCAEEAMSANVFPIHPDGASVKPDKQRLTREEQADRAVELHDEARQKAEARKQEIKRATEAKHAARAARQGRLGERIIMTVLALVFLGAGLAAAALSGFANYQAFSQTVSDPVQGQIWGWSGVIASVCSFGGFTFFWWHTSAKRMKEGFRALVFALAGAATSIAGTAMFMANNTLDQQSAISQAERTRGLLETQVSDWTRQLDGIPATTRSVAGLEAYIAGVELAGRAHQKPYRDAQNELGLARRRADLEVKVAAARTQLLGQETGVAVMASPPREALPAWFFAVMLEVFSSQGTSIAFVSLLLLYGRRQVISPDLQLGPDS